MAHRRSRTARLSGDDRQLALLATAEKLLGERSFDDISIEDLAAGAGISRPTFYFYFSSKDEVLLALLDTVIAEVRHRVAALPRDFELEPAATWRRSIEAFIEVFSAHRAVSNAAMTARMRNADVHALWATSMQSWADYSTEIILAERARGAAPDGIDAHDLAVALNLMNERVLSASLSGDAPRIDQARSLDVLSSIWLRSIYGTTPD
ncbi:MULTISPECIES: TetR/AcrR family transcriptional regulator [Subtercola]|uniref:TetR/AcrR family transcriptional regulator n=1 Tax=Subtercola vilae TaxID=2056433 RepID=A0A4T2C3Y1_9MICO|nr:MULTISPECIES: TetR/AcrR family transcriptional regulator [Subtercola]MEA9986238.1 TetR/AcrR family transcriptional regulator [Subtercola sp. RTI3]TIH39063.1 TetR/AcrR family transcriptional regulator [Subtercola vilae]